MVDMCKHPNVKLVNPYELIRKYICEDCGDVMMCSCEKEYGDEYLPHQLGFGTELESQEEFIVTVGFQAEICEECRNLPITAYPKAEIYGNTSKIKRYYWREISMETTKLFASWAKSQGYSNWMVAWRENAEKHKEIENRALNSIKQLHKTSPKYIYSEISQQEILDTYGVEIENLNVQFVKKGKKSKRVEYKGDLISSEQFAIRTYEERGYQAIHFESIPFHCLFGTLMWNLIQDPGDEKIRKVGFGRRDKMQGNENPLQIWTLMPQDFGSKGYGLRRDNDISIHLSNLPTTTRGLLEFFDVSLERSSDLRQYLWAHEEESIVKARRIIEIIPSAIIIEIQNYLVRNYWKRYLGWPDLIIWDRRGYTFIEVKASRDKLSEVQKNWISGNYNFLHLPYRILKLHNVVKQPV